MIELAKDINKTAGQISTVLIVLNWVELIDWNILQVLAPTLIGGAISLSLMAIYDIKERCKK